MKNEWTRVQNVREFLAQRGRVSVGVHSPKAFKRLPWPVCSRCGLVWLRNDATRKAGSKACIVEE